MKRTNPTLPPVCLPRPAQLPELQAGLLVLALREPFVWSRGLKLYPSNPNPMFFLMPCKLM